MKFNKTREPFSVAWYKSDTTFTIKYLKDGVVDCGITYSEDAEDIAIKQGVVKSRHYAFRDHFLLVGPHSNPAGLDKKKDNVLDMFAKLFAAAEEGTSDPPVRFLSRFDKSATNIKDALLWLKVGQVPWAAPHSSWYHQYEVRKLNPRLSVT